MAWAAWMTEFASALAFWYSAKRLPYSRFNAAFFILMRRTSRRQSSLASLEESEEDWTREGWEGSRS